MNDVLRKTAVSLIAVALALSLVEGALAIDGRYDHLATTTLVSSPALWEKATSAREYTRHPDLGTPIEARSDTQGVRNHSSISTEQKQNIIAVFGDSFTENRRVEDRFTFTTLLDGLTSPAARVVNYGVDGYGVDQSYLRYKKYEAHDIRHVVYLFGANDLRNLYETNIALLVGDDDVRFLVPSPSLTRQALGRLRLTYLVLSAYASLEQAESAPSSTAKFEARTHDRFADTLSDRVLDDDGDIETDRWMRTFVLVVSKWQSEVRSRGRSFTVVVLPRDDDTALARRLFASLDAKAVLFLEPHFGEFTPFQFNNDGHWNEYGNLRAAQVLASSGSLPFHHLIARRESLDTVKSEIDAYDRQRP